MSENFTYETNNTEKLETYEWDNLWWEYANDTTKKDRILLIGDSISCGYRGLVNKELKGKIYADGLGTSKALDNPSFFPLISYVTSQQQNCRLIQFNNGLHGWHLSIEEYKEYYQKMVSFLRESYSDKILILALTTPARNSKDLLKLDARNDEVILRNQAVLEIAKTNNLPVNDMYAPLIDHPEYFTPDGIHLTTEGYQLLAKQCVELFSNYLG